MTEPKDDFEKALAQLNAQPPRELPPSHPDQLLKNAGRGGQMPAAKLAGHYESRYKKFSMGDEKQVAELEDINNHILNDGWLPGREEWIHTKEGATYIILKYLVPKDLPKKPPKDEPKKKPAPKPKKKKKRRSSGAVRKS